MARIQRIQGQTTVLFESLENNRGTSPIALKDAHGNVIYVVTKRVAIDAPIDRFRLMTNIYNGVNERLKAGNIDGAVSNFTNTIRENYRTAFTAAGSGLAALANGFGTIKGLQLHSTFAELSVVRDTVDGDIVFTVFLIRDSDGIWRIDGF